MVKKSISELNREIKEAAVFLVEYCDKEVTDLKNAHGSKLDKFLAKIEKIGKDSKLFIENKLPLSDYKNQLALTGTELLKDWLLGQKISGNELQRDASKQAVRFLLEGKGDYISLFKNAVYAVQKEDFAIDQSAKVIEPFFRIILESARICRRSLQLNEQIAMN